jgi:D-alanyl-D-alanine endopeptidase (penicillin-binding protein 7)
MVKILQKPLIWLALVFAINSAYAEDISAQSWLVTNEQGEVMGGKNTTEIRSIASITKLMTAMVILDSGQSLNEIIPKKMYGINPTRRQLITLAVVKSDNLAAKYLCEYYHGGTKECISAMNKKANALGMVDTTFTDSTGLFNTNVSTAEDLVKLLNAAATYEVIHQDSNKHVVVWNVNKKKKITFRNTNPIVADEKFAVSKTGYIRRSGGCIAMIVSTLHGTRTIIILGSRNIKDRIPEARILLAKF